MLGIYLKLWSIGRVHVKNIKVRVLLCSMKGMANTWIEALDWWGNLGKIWQWMKWEWWVYCQNKMEETLYGSRPLMEDDLWLNTTMDDDNLGWKTTFKGIRSLRKNDLWGKETFDGLQPMTAPTQPSTWNLTQILDILTFSDQWGNFYLKQAMAELKCSAWKDLRI